MKPPKEFRDTQRSAAARRAYRLTKPLALDRFAAVRTRIERDTAADMFVEYLDLSTLTDTADGAHRLADAADARNHAAIRKGTALAHVRIARLRIEEVR